MNNVAVSSWAKLVVVPRKSLPRGTSQIVANATADLRKAPVVEPEVACRGRICSVFRLSAMYEGEHLL